MAQIAELGPFRWCGDLGVFIFLHTGMLCAAMLALQLNARSLESAQVPPMHGQSPKSTAPATQTSTSPRAPKAIGPEPSGVAAALAMAATDPCGQGRSLLWPQHFSTHIRPESLSPSTRSQIKAAAGKALKKNAAPIPTLGSAGRTDKQDPLLLASRRAFQDADNAANLTLAYKITGDRRFLDKAVGILLAWARINRPTGHPIDETRLDKLIYAYDLLRCDLDQGRRDEVQGYLRRMQAAKLAWRFGDKTAHNNHRTHQLKMLLLLARVLEDAPAYETALADAKEHLKANIDATTGETLDHKERGALHYQAYDLEPWLEIVLLSGCCREPVAKAYDFLRERIAAGAIHGQFAQSTAPIDAARSKAGFGYAQIGGDFDTSKAARCVLVHQTLQGRETDPAMDRLAEGAATSANLFFLARRQAWDG